MIVDQAIYRRGRRRECGDLSDELATLRHGAEGFIWIGLKDPTNEEFGLVNQELGLHPLAVEDAVIGNQRAKIEQYEGSLFVVLKTLRYIDETSDIETGEVMLFIGDRFVVTVHQRPISQIDEAVRRWSQHEGELGHNIGALLYALLDSMVDTYFPVLDAIGEDVDEVQEAIFSHPDRRTLRRLSRLRRELLNARRVLAPEREVINTLLRRDRPILPAKRKRAASAISVRVATS